MKKADHPARLVVLRTKPIEALLQEIWAVRPDIRNKISLTVSTAFAALVREGNHSSAAVVPESHIHQQAPAAVPEIKPSPVASLPVEPINAASTVSDDESHPDAAWTF